MYTDFMLDDLQPLGGLYAPVNRQCGGGSGDDNDKDGEVTILPYPPYDPKKGWGDRGGH
jgi:hypothetical protein